MPHGTPHACVLTSPPPPPDPDLAEYFQACRENAHINNDSFSGEDGDPWDAISNEPRTVPVDGQGVNTEGEALSVPADASPEAAAAGNKRNDCATATITTTTTPKGGAALYNRVNHEGISVWRATSGDSPLRGRAARLTLRHRASMQQLRRSLRSHEEAGGEEEEEGSAGRQAAVYRGASAKAAAQELASPPLLSVPSRCDHEVMNESAGYISPQEHALLQQGEAIESKNAILFDVLCALRQSPSSSCSYVSDTATSSFSVASGSMKWQFTQEAEEKFSKCGLGPASTAVLNALLSLATHLAQVQSAVQDVRDAVQLAVRLCGDNDGTRTTKNGRSFLGQRRTDREEKSEDGEEEQGTMKQMLRRVLQGCGLGDDAALSGICVTAQEALATAALAALSRLCLYVGLLSEQFSEWVLHVQECQSRWRVATVRQGRLKSGGNNNRYDVHDGMSAGFLSSPPRASSAASLLRTSAAESAKLRRRTEGREGEQEGQPWQQRHTGGSGISSGRVVREAENPMQLTDLVKAVQRNALPLLHVQAIMTDSRCLSALREWVSTCESQKKSNKEKAFNQQQQQREEGRHSSIALHADAVSFMEACASSASTLLDFLIVRASGLQTPATRPAYVVHMALLVYCTWPYAKLMTASVFGFVTDIEPRLWRRNLPRLFRSSFSHLKVEPREQGRYPTDILSLVLACIGYGDEEEDDDDDNEGDNAEKDSALREKEGLRRASVARLLASRQFVLRNFVAYAAVAGGGDGSDGMEGRREMRKSRRAIERRRRTSWWSAPASEHTREEVGSSKVSWHTRHGSRGASPKTHRQREVASARELTLSEILTQLLRDGCTDGGQLSALAKTEKEDEAARIGKGEGNSTIKATDECDVNDALCSTLLPLRFTVMDRAVMPLQSVWSGGSPSQALSAHAERAGREATGQAPSSVCLGSAVTWVLEAVDSAITPDVVLTSLDHRAAPWQQSGEGVLLHLDTSIPAARWVTAAMLLPIALVARQVQQHRLRDLFRCSLPLPVSAGGYRRVDATRTGAAGRRSRDLREFLHEGDDERGAPLEDEVAVFVVDGGGSSARRLPCSLYTYGGLTGFTSADKMKFAEAVQFVLDVALCRDTARLMDGFLAQLADEHHWWFRRGRRYYESSGTASEYISGLFAESLRDKKFGHLVKLSVLPSIDDASDDGGVGRSRKMAATAPAGRHEELSKASQEEEEEEDFMTSAVSRDMLDTFACFELTFDLPGPFQWVLLPRTLSVHYASGGSGELLDSYTELFWFHRQSRGLDGGTTAAEDTRTSTPSGKQQLSTQKRSRGMPVGDIWSHAFGYLCSLHYAQRSLRARRKALQMKDTQNHALLAVLGKGPRAARPLQHVTRGLGSAYYAISFVVDTLLSFTQREASILIHHVEQKFSGSVEESGVGSCAELSTELDKLLLQFHSVCFPARRIFSTSVASNATAPPSISQPGAEKEVRDCITTVLALALDPTQLPVKLITARTRVASEALVETVRSLRPATVLKARLHPLLVMLTFNDFYGAEGSVSYSFR